jgi:hypothetical protein
MNGVLAELSRTLFESQVASPVMSRAIPIEVLESFMEDTVYHPPQ